MSLTGIMNMDIVGKLDPSVDYELGDLVIYGLIPTDLPSLRTPNGPDSKGGKVGAHGFHAGNQILKYHSHPDVQVYIQNGIKYGADYFNTCITLDATTKQIDTAVGIAQRLGYVADKVVDTSYPWFVDAETAKFLRDDCVVNWGIRRDGKVLVLRKATTFGWMLGAKSDPVFRAICGAFDMAE